MRLEPAYTSSVSLAPPSVGSLFLPFNDIHSLGSLKLVAKIFILFILKLYAHFDGINHHAAPIRPALVLVLPFLGLMLEEQAAGTCRGPFSCSASLNFIIGELFSRAEGDAIYDYRCAPEVAEYSPKASLPL